VCEDRRRFYDWAVIDLAEPRPGSHRLLVRRNRTTGELAYYRCFSPAPAPLATLVRVAGSRWRVEETFQAGKGLAGLDEHQLRRFTSWSRWVTLAMLAHAFLAVIRADEHTRHPAPDGLIPLTCNEIQRLFYDAGRPARARRGPPAPLVRLATSPPGPSPGQPLPEASRESDMKIMIYGWSTNPQGMRSHRDRLKAL
jgi:hypothetical protein